MLNKNFVSYKFHQVKIPDEFDKNFYRRKFVMAFWDLFIPNTCNHMQNEIHFSKF